MRCVQAVGWPPSAVCVCFRIAFANSVNRWNANLNGIISEEGCNGDKTAEGGHPTDKLSRARNRGYWVPACAGMTDVARV